MDVGPGARSVLAREWRTALVDLRMCTGSRRFGIEPHQAPPDDFPREPSQKDGVGRMCRLHWRQYTAGLARDAKARGAADGAPAGMATSEAVVGPQPRGRVKRKASHTRHEHADRDAASPAAELVEEGSAT